MNKAKEYAGIDYFKIIAAFLIVAIHTSPLTSVNGTADFILTRIVGRVAVPFFFMVTGYFLLAPAMKSQKNDTHKLKSFVIRTCKLYGVAILLYIPINIYAGYFESKALLLKLFKDLVFDGTLYHLWYLPASILGVLIVYALTKKLKSRSIYALVIILYLIGLFGDSYYNLVAQVPFIKYSYDILFHLFDYTRNGIFFAPIFLVMGAAIANQKDESKTRTNSIGLLLSMGLFMTEGLLLHHFNMPRHDSMYLFLLPSMYFLFKLLLTFKGHAHKSLRPLSMLIYILHPMAIVLVRGLAKLFKIQVILIDNSILHYIAVCILSLTLATLFLLIQSRLKSLPPSPRGRAWVEIDLNHLYHNARVLQNILPSSCNLMAVVKANAYGHGSVKVSQALNKIGIKTFAVATLSEAIDLRKKGVKGDILILGYTHPLDFRCLVRYGLIQTVIDSDYAQTLDAYRKKISVHIKIDTGMHRLGENYANLPNLEKIFQCKYLIVKGTYTHLSVSDSLNKSKTAFSRLQIERFYKTIKLLQHLGHNPGDLHIQSSYGVLNYPELNCDYARVGIALYGVLSTHGDNPLVSADLKPVLALRARIAMLKNVDIDEPVGYGTRFMASKNMKIAVVSIGYGDGIPRNLPKTSNFVLVKCKKVPVIGLICMDQMIIDVTDIPDIKSNDIVTLIGKDGDEELRCEEVAKDYGTISNELLSRLGSRLEHVFIT